MTILQRTAKIKIDMATTKKTTEPASEAPAEVYLVSHPQEDGVIAVKATSAQDAAEQTKPKEQE